MISNWLRNRWWALREAWTFAGIYNGHRRSKHPTPLLAANLEVFYRAEYLERFRDYATEAYLAGTDLDAAKTAFIHLHLGRDSLHDRETTMMLKAIILDMGADEALHPEAYRKWCADLEEFIEECRSDAIARFGGSGLSPNTKRVLRGKA